MIAAPKPSSAHADLQDAWFKHLKFTADQHRGPYFMVMKEQLLPNGQRADILTLAWTPDWADIYEIKGRRDDFTGEMRTRKWEGYLGQCRELVFVTPYDLVTEEEIPEAAGWITQGARGGFKRRKWGHKDPTFKASYRQVKLCLEHEYGA